MSSPCTRTHPPYGFAWAASCCTAPSKRLGLLSPQAEAQSSAGSGQQRAEQHAERDGPNNQALAPDRTARATTNARSPGQSYMCPKGKRGHSPTTIQRQGPGSTFCMRLGGMKQTRRQLTPPDLRRTRLQTASAPGQSKADGLRSYTMAGASACTGGRPKTCFPHKPMP